MVGKEILYSIPNLKNIGAQSTYTLQCYNLLSNSKSFQKRFVFVKLKLKIEASMSILSNQFQLNLNTRTVASSEADTTTAAFLKCTKCEL